MRSFQVTKTDLMLLAQLERPTFGIPFAFFVVATLFCFTLLFFFFLFSSHFQTRIKAGLEQPLFLFLL